MTEDDNALVERLRAFDYNVDIATFYDKDPECVSEAANRIEALEAANERLRGLVQGWHYLAVGPDEMGDYYTQKQLIKASEPYAHPALRAISGEKQ